VNDHRVEARVGEVEGLGVAESQIDLTAQPLRARLRAIASISGLTSV
jgi:hypothetical protein